MDMFCAVHQSPQLNEAALSAPRRKANTVAAPLPWIKHYRHYSALWYYSAYHISTVTLLPKSRTMTLEEAFGQTVSALRKGRNLSQTDLAAAAGYSLRYVGDLERGKKSPTLRTVEKLADTLHLSVRDLLFQTEGLQQRTAVRRRRK
jgi:DNA-binding XRE family transcriptional regulator